MLYHREGFPEDNEIVLCTVTAVNPSSVFCTLDEYGKTGLIHISEISPGRIRNIRDYVSEGRKIVCTVLKTNIEKGHIDLSLRRVTESQKRNKNNAIKQEMRAEAIVEQASKQLKIPLKKLYEEISSALLEEYEYIHGAFADIVENKKSIKDYGIKKEYAVVLDKLIYEKIKPKKVVLSGTLEMSTYEGEGLEIIKKLITGEMKKHKNLDIKYLGGGRYSLNVTAPEYKEAEKVLKTSLEIMEKTIKRTEGGVFSFKKE